MARSSPASNPFVMLNGESIPYRVVRNAGARRSVVRVSPAGIDVVLAKRTPLRVATELLTMNGEWILKQRALLAAKGRLLPPLPPGDPTYAMVRGVSFSVNWQSVASRSGMVLCEESTRTILVLVPESYAERRSEILLRWMQKQASTDLAISVARRSAEMQLAPTRVSVRAQRSRWGSCSSRGNLSFNRALILAHPSVLDYVVVHELAHLRELNHSARFWEIVARYCPNHAVPRRWLQENSWRLDAPFVAQIHPL